MRKNLSERDDVAEDLKDFCSTSSHLMKKSDHVISENVAPAWLWTTPFLEILFSVTHVCQLLAVLKITGSVNIKQSTEILGHRDKVNSPLKSAKVLSFPAIMVFPSLLTVGLSFPVRWTSTPPSVWHTENCCWFLKNIPGMSRLSGVTNSSKKPPW